ncbi:MAG: DUF2213 domain-containing protein [FCB group bacterium]|nr:DUF2213 domain-containing protein [FCB group bacterium]
MLFCRISLNASTQKVRHDTLDGKPYLVVPMVMITEGVHNGSNGPLYYSPSELKKTPQSWDAKPIVVYHPTKNGLGVSACSKEIIETQQVGVILNTKYDKKAGKLRAEAWLDPEKLEAVDDRVLLAVNSNKLMEVSTGLFTDALQSPGTWNGKKYSHVATNFRPDHLAILPDQKGSCSIADGAGLMQANQLSHDGIRDKLRQSVFDRYGERAWISEVFDDYLIYEVDGDYFKMNYTIGENDATLKGESTEVEKVVEYRPLGDMVDNVTQEKEQEQMGKATEKTEIVSALIANEATAWTEEDRDFLTNMEDGQLKKFTPVATEVVSNKETPPAVPPVQKEELPVSNESQPTFEELLAKADPKMQAVIRNGIAANEANRQSMIDAIVANKGNKASAEYLATLEDGVLQTMADFATNAEPVKAAKPNYYGSATAPTGNQSGSQPRTLGIPTTLKPKA